MAALIAVLILTGKEGTQMPSRALETPFLSPGQLIDPFACLVARSAGLENLFNASALCCIRYLKHASNSNAVIAALSYLSWMLSAARLSAKLDEACNTQFDLQGIPHFVQLAANIAMQDYRLRYAAEQLEVVV